MVTPRVSEAVEAALPLLLRAATRGVVAGAIWKAPTAAAQRDDAQVSQEASEASEGRSPVPSPEGCGRRRRAP
eukprot:4621280-Alexandrium_andersonii.AAC.1